MNKNILRISFGLYALFYIITSLSNITYFFDNIRQIRDFNSFLHIDDLQKFSYKLLISTGINNLVLIFTGLLLLVFVGYLVFFSGKKFNKIGIIVIGLAYCITYGALNIIEGLIAGYFMFFVYGIVYTLPVLIYLIILIIKEEKQHIGLFILAGFSAIFCLSSLISMGQWFVVLIFHHMISYMSIISLIGGFMLRASSLIKEILLLVMYVILAIESAKYYGTKKEIE